MVFKELKNKFNPHELEHSYGTNVHVLNNPYCFSLLARSCQPACGQPEFNENIRILYRSMASYVANALFSKSKLHTKTRMHSKTTPAVIQGEGIAPKQPVVIVSLARAGTIPSNELFEFYARVIVPECLRVDHVYIQRTTDKNDHVIGAKLSGSKIGESIDNAIMLIADPMGATGSSILTVMNHYQTLNLGTPFMWATINLIITPEFIRNTLAARPNLNLFTLRVDRGMSNKKILSSALGQYPSQEKGLNQNDYIIPGGGGFGELMSHVWN